MKKIEEPAERPMTARERLELVLMGLAKDQAVAALCEEAGISRSLFYRWLAQVRRALTEALETKKRGRKAKSIIESPREVEALQDRLLELEREVAKLRKERDRFKLVTEVAQRVIHKNAWPSRGRRGRPKKNRRASPSARDAYAEHWRAGRLIRAADFAAAWGVSRSTHWRWVHGKSRSFRGRPRVRAELRRAVVALDRRWRSTWGVREIAHVLGLGPTTVAKILSEERGPKPKRFRPPHDRRTRFLRRDVMWSSDFMKLPGGWWLIKTIDEASGLRLRWGVVRAPTACALVRHARKTLAGLGRAPLVWKFDHGSAFTSGEFQALLAARRVAAYPTRCRAPWTNGRSERDNRDVRAWLIPIERRRLGLAALRRDVSAGLRMLNRVRPRAVLGYRTAAEDYSRLPGVERVSRARFLPEARAARDESSRRRSVRRALKRRRLMNDSLSSDRPSRASIGSSPP